ncbi:UDP-N-acetylmuramoyl-tripeptide--D-alanyl-D-alanine ligase [Tumebacillus lipolyticus]|uniref:UDP-N-acetylmuramoyl-tripeptide--D-alanyl-D-alanine ligase n=1 Tax=Tumebacillus lipolyticus TaxID=1280370 RepID=A0ABW4ZYJ0_9BACL
MISKSVAELTEMVAGSLLQGSPELMASGVATDTRSEMTGKLFIPLVGERFDGHQFLLQAEAQGAVVALWQAGRPHPSTSLALIEVDDTLLALQRLSAAYRRSLDVRVIGITGSNGKTSTKDMIATVLAEAFRVQKTQGNLNNHIGLPLMLLSLEESTEVAVLEMGMNHAGEIELLTQLAAPEFGVITNIGEAHIEYLGSREGIAAAKCELIEGLPASGKAILFGDEPLLRASAGKTKAERIWFGFEDGNDVQAVEVENLGVRGSRFSVFGDETRYELPVMGQHQLGNGLAAVAVGRALGMSGEQIRAGLAKASLTARRLEVKRARLGGTVIDDAYNASPTSMRAALSMFASMTGGFKVAVLGGMLELGPDSARMHQEIGAFLAEMPFDQLVCVGELAADIALGARQSGFPAERIYHFPEREETVDHLQAVLRQHADDEGDGAILLCKASLGMKFVEIVRALV